jgi:hypothetical protein
MVIRKLAKMKDTLQWTGAGFIIVMYVLNAIGPSMYPYNIIMAMLGTVCFLTWSILVANKPQMVVNAVAMLVCTIGLIKAFI